MDPHPATEDGPASLDDLYAAPPSAFVAGRDRLARRLRDEGRKDEAAEVRRRRRPSVVAWALNQVRRRAPDELDALLALGGRLRQAQQEMLTGGGREALRAALAERKALVDRLASRAGGWLVGEEVSASPHRDELAAVLEAATVDEEVARLLQDAQLETEPDVRSGLGGLVSSAPAAGEPSAAVESDDDHRITAAEEQARSDRRRADEATTAAAEATRSLHEARQAVRDLEDALDRARRALVDAERDEDRLERIAGDARQRAEQSEDRVRALRSE